MGSIVSQPLLISLLQATRRICYQGVDEKRWWQDRDFLLHRFILYPASWLQRRGVTLSEPEYQDLVLGILEGVRRHGNAEAVKYWPGYLAHVVQEHMKHQGEAIYQKAKQTRALVEKAILTARAAPPPDPIARLAELRQVLAASRPSRRRDRAIVVNKQLSLL